MHASAGAFERRMRAIRRACWNRAPRAALGVGDLESTFVRRGRACWSLSARRWTASRMCERDTELRARQPARTLRPERPMICLPMDLAPRGRNAPMVARPRRRRARTGMRGASPCGTATVPRVLCWRAASTPVLLASDLASAKTRQIPPRRDRRARVSDRSIRWWTLERVATMGKTACRRSSARSWRARPARRAR